MPEVGLCLCKLVVWVCLQLLVKMTLDASVTQQCTAGEIRRLSCGTHSAPSIIDYFGILSARSFSPHCTRALMTWGFLVKITVVHWITQNTDYSSDSVKSELLSVIYLPFVCWLKWEAVEEFDVSFDPALEICFSPLTLCVFARSTSSLPRIEWAWACLCLNAGTSYCTAGRESEGHGEGTHLSGSFAVIPLYVCSYAPGRLQ